jgi:hypothetical protein
VPGRGRRVLSSGDNLLAVIYVCEVAVVVVKDPV